LSGCFPTPELDFDAKDFLPKSNPVEVKHMDDAMSSITKATISFFAVPRGEFTLTNLHINLYLVIIQYVV